MHEFEEALSIIQKEVTEEANIILGMVIDEKMQDEIRVTVIATGIGKIEQKKTIEASTVRPLRRIRPEGVVPVIDYDLLQVPPSVRQRIPLADAQFREWNRPNPNPINSNSSRPEEGPSSR